MRNDKVASSACLGVLLNKSFHTTFKIITILHSKTKMLIKKTSIMLLQELISHPPQSLQQSPNIMLWQNIIFK